MTNTRITDVEIMERRYPVLVRRFALRHGTGGAGQHPGGDGVTRELEFRRDVKCSILSERRVYQPYGMNGGEPAALGLNLWVSKDRHGTERTVSMGSKNTVPMKSGGGCGRQKRLELSTRSSGDHDPRRRRMGSGRDTVSRGERRRTAFCRRRGTYTAKGATA